MESFARRDLFIRDENGVSRVLDRNLPDQLLRELHSHSAHMIEIWCGRPGWIVPEMDQQWVQLERVWRMKRAVEDEAFPGKWKGIMLGDVMVEW